MKDKSFAYCILLTFSLICCLSFFFLNSSNHRWETRGGPKLGQIMATSSPAEQGENVALHSQRSTQAPWSLFCCLLGAGPQLPWGWGPWLPVFFALAPSQEHFGGECGQHRRQLGWTLGRGSSVSDRCLRMKCWTKNNTAVQR